MISRCLFRNFRFCWRNSKLLCERFMHAYMGILLTEKGQIILHYFARKIVAIRFDRFLKKFTRIDVVRFMGN